MSCIELKNVGKHYNMGEITIVAAADVNFTVKKECWQLLPAQAVQAKPRFSIFSVEWAPVIREKYTSTAK